MGHLTLTYGSQTFDRSSGKVNVFAMACDGTNHRTYPGQVLSQPFRTTAANSTPAAKNGLATHGFWKTQTFDSVDGVVLCVHASTTANGAPLNSGDTYIALRGDAPLITVIVHLRSHRNAVFDTINVFQGRGDILEVGELHERGIVLTDRYIMNNMDEEELDELFEYNTVGAGTKKPDLMKVRRPDGNVVGVVVPGAPRRKVRIRRK
jgi:hypothetical protein